MARIHSVTGRTVTPVTDGWEMTVLSPSRPLQPDDHPPLPPGERGRSPSYGTIPAPVPGTAAQALREAGLWSLESPAPLHDRDVVYRTRIAGHGPHTLRFHGLATLAEVWLDDERILASDSMVLAHEIPVTLTGEAVLTIRFHALHPHLATRKGRARWRPRLIEPASLRFVRTTPLGHMPGWCPPVHAVGPYRPVELVAETGPVRVRSADLRTAHDGRDGRLALTLTVEAPDGVRPAATVAVAGLTVPLAWTGTGPGAATLRADLTIPGVEPWWPHTHGHPALHAVTARIGDTRVDLGRTGFRSLAVDRGADGRGFALLVNGERIFCRGACWTPPDLAALPGGRDAYEPGLTLLRDAGANMVRVGGTMLYEADAFFELCDELGILVWQDAMLANFDYPTDPAFLASVRVEIAQLLDRSQASPALAVLCGGSEMEQQAAMLGLPRAAWSQPALTEILQAELAARRPDVAFVPNSPTAGPLPFAADSGVSHYYGVGAYQRPLEDARRANVRFASECLAFSHVPDGALGVPAVHHPRWKERVPRDSGASWDFEDVRDHYLERLHAVDPRRLRYEDPDRYLRLSRAVTGEVIEAVFGEWRRGASTCAGGLVWLWRDPWPGAGWGVVAADGTPKAAWHAMRRAFRPVQILLSDEGVNGLAVHLINETAMAIPASVTLTALRDGALPVFRAERALTLPPRSAREISAAELADRFFDLNHAYRFGPAAHDVVVATLTRSGETIGAVEPIAQSFHFPRGRALPRAELGLTARLARRDEGWGLTLATSRFACSVHVEDDAYRAEEAWFHLPPGAERTVRLLPRSATAPATMTKAPDGEVHALNALAPVRYRGTA
ncbi:beta-mannosidase [Azospirillum agricola]|uniref:glycoside hydrolase family 2 protein n=1 Tax=Azospirillum agricola TaxID=1720247 RepID=UPI001AE13A96|nr:glycoside hydrolase family 2 protein [Azospirillum agricola]MBP2228668.1 beta-mannosidase [Azospirillum agricola]